MRSFHLIALSLMVLLGALPACAGGEENNPHAIAADPPQKYLSCQQESDCTLEPGICGEAMAVNKSHAQAYRDASAEANSVIRCVRAGTPVENFTPVCNAGRCDR